MVAIRRKEKRKKTKLGTILNPLQHGFFLKTHITLNLSSDCLCSPFILFASKASTENTSSSQPPREKLATILLKLKITSAKCSELRIIRAHTRTQARYFRLLKCWVAKDGIQSLQDQYEHRSEERWGAFDNVQEKCVTERRYTHALPIIICFEPTGRGFRVKNNGLRNVCTVKDHLESLYLYS